jgi:hypothetical protein
VTKTIPMRNARIGIEKDTGAAVLKLVNAEVKVSPDGKNVQVSAVGFQTRKKPAVAETLQDGVDLHGVIVQQAANGNLIITRDEDVSCKGSLAPSQDLQPGQATKDGIFFAYSTDKDGTKRAWFTDLNVAQDDEGNTLSLDFNERAAYAEQRNQESHLDHNNWTVAQGWEGSQFNALAALFNARAAVGGFEAAQYGSSSRVYAAHSGLVQVVDFKTGIRNAVEETARTPFRLVRSVKV